MAKRSLRLILPLFAALGVACGTEGDGGGALAPGPEPEPRVLTRLEVTPTDYALNIVRPGNTLQLTIRAYDKNGAPMAGTDAATYASSAPAIAAVSSSGVVTAAALGTAEITATLTVDGVTRTASMTVTVYTYDFSDLAGVYDLTAQVTSFDPAWGEDLTGYRYTAVLTLPEGWGPPLFRGTYADLRLVGPGGDSYQIAASGLDTGYIFRDGRLVLELVGPPFTVTLAVSSLASGGINGRFGAGGHISGPLTAERRQAE